MFIINAINNKSKKEIYLENEDNNAYEDVNINYRNNNYLGNNPDNNNNKRSYILESKTIELKTDTNGKKRYSSLKKNIILIHNQI